jgi:glycosyltransferase involved in cell wall biosynthesis
MPGQMADVGPWLAYADLLVSTSAFEGSPAALIEALAAGVPVVATRCPGGSEELLRDGVGGTLIPMDEAPSAAAAILETAARPRDRSALRRLVSRYGETRAAAEHLAVLDRVAADPGLDEAA